MSERDAYAVLQVVPTADEDVIKAAYRALARRFHPDGQTPDQRRMAEINQAYDHLKTPEARAKYDGGTGPGVPVGPGRPEPSAPGPAEPAARPSTLYERWQASTTGKAEGLGATVLDFGTYQGWQIADVAKKDPGYLRWLSRNPNGYRYRAAIAAVLPDVVVGR